MAEKYILTVRELHFGYIKDTFRRGAVIEHDEDRGVLVIDGRKFDEARDLDILKRQAVKFPHKPWIIPYSKESYQDILGVIQAEPEVERPAKPRPGEGMPIVRSDEDDHQTIDISDTKISRHTQQAKEHARAQAKARTANRTLPIIKGDQTPEERLAELANKTDMSSIAERVTLKRQKRSMTIIRDDSLGMGVGKGSTPMNAGQALMSREEADSRKGEFVAQAEARKTQLDRTRKQAGVRLPEEDAGIAVTPTDQDIPDEVAEALDAIEDQSASDLIEDTDSAVTGMLQGTDVDVAALEADFEEQAAELKDDEQDGELEDLRQENDELKAENAEMKSTQATILERLAALETPKPKPKTAKKGGPRKTATRRTAVPAEAK